MAWNASLKHTNFDTLLKLGSGWTLGRNAVSQNWTALHTHGCNNYGWMGANGYCSVCGQTFPDKVIGMWNMMKALD